MCSNTVSYLYSGVYFVHLHHRDTGQDCFFSSITNEVIKIIK